jgi:hypothetical protein
VPKVFQTLRAGDQVESAFSETFDEYERAFSTRLLDLSRMIQKSKSLRMGLFATTASFGAALALLNCQRTNFDWARRIRRRGVAAPDLEGSRKSIGLLDSSRGLECPDESTLAE